MGRLVVGFCCCVVLLLGLVNSGYAQDLGVENKDGLLATLGLNNIFAQAAPAEKKSEEKKEEETMKLSFGGFGQFRFDYNDAAIDTFDLLRARFRVKGDYDILTFFVQVDTETPTTLLLDYWINLACPKNKKLLNLKAGRFALPFGWQVPISPYDLLTINYSQIVSRLFGQDTITTTGAGFDNLRDQGVCLHGTYELGKEGALVGYVVGFFNGESRAVSDTTENQAGIIRAYITPKKGITIGTSYYDGKRFYSTDPLGLAAAGREYSRRMNGIDWKFDLGKLLIQGEFISGTQNPSDEGKHETAPSTHFKRNTVDGYFIEVGYYLVEKKFQVVGKLDVIDLPIYTFSSGSWNKSSSTNRKRTYALGGNWYFCKYAKLQFIWEHKDDEGKGTGQADDKGYILLGVNF